MNNFNHANDKLKAPHCDSINNGNQFDNEMHYLKSVTALLESSYEGFHRAHNYNKANLEKHLRDEGDHQRKFYIKIFDVALLALDFLLDDMKARCDTSMEGK